MGDRFEHLDRDEVISIDKSDTSLISHNTFKVGDLIDAILAKLTSYLNHNSSWVDEGVDAEVLKFGAKGWQKGKLKIALEFYPDSPQSDNESNESESDPSNSNLDDIRQMMSDGDS
jgi:hypothetical protein